MANPGGAGGKANINGKNVYERWQCCNQCPAADAGFVLGLPTGHRASWELAQGAVHRLPRGACWKDWAYVSRVPWLAAPAGSRPASLPAVSDGPVRAPIIFGQSSLHGVPSWQRCYRQRVHPLRARALQPHVRYLAFVLRLPRGQVRAWCVQRAMPSLRCRAVRTRCGGGTLQGVSHGEAQ